MQGSSCFIYLHISFSYLFWFKSFFAQVTILVFLMSPWICKYLWKKCWCYSNSNQLQNVHPKASTMPRTAASQTQTSILCHLPSQPRQKIQNVLLFLHLSQLPQSNPANSTRQQNPYPSLISTATKLFQALANLFSQNRTSLMSLPKRK